MVGRGDQLLGERSFKSDGGDNLFYIFYIFIFLIVFFFTFSCFLGLYILNIFKTFTLSFCGDFMVVTAQVVKHCH